jgi:hypothetical protein
LLGTRICQSGFKISELRVSGKESLTTEIERRTVGELLALAEVEEERTRKQLAAEAEARRIRELKALATKAEDTWTFAEQLIQRGNGRAYDEAWQLLVKLHDLAIHQGTETAYEERLERIRAAYPRRRALLERLDKAGLP